LDPGGLEHAMLSGFNTNFRYRGVLFHVQTEDSGLENPHVISHLFHGGNIMASEKRDYSDLVQESSGPDLEDAIRKLMEGQHKSLLRELSRGEHDPAIEQRMGPDVFRVESVDKVADAPSVTEEEPPPSLAEATRIEVAEPEPDSERTQPVSRLFGERVVSEKPLDEVVLDYLVESARNKRKRTTK
jgi:hypothetical protein